MLALARALMLRPKLVLLDEPSLGLAPMVTAEIFRIVGELNEKEGLAVLVVEQNAALAFEASSRAYVLEVGKVAVEGSSAELRRNESVRTVISGLLMLLAFDWTQLAQQIVIGLASGGVWATLAVALVLIYRSTGVVNFAQGEMAMFSTFIAWSLVNHGLSYWAAFFLTVAISFVAGVAIERVVIRPVESAPVLTVVIVTLGPVLPRQRRGPLDLDA